MSDGRQLWVLAGGNGAGKSTFHALYLQPRGVRLLNADVIAKAISPEKPESVSYEAASHAERLRRDLLHKGVSFCFETVFSHESKIDFIASAKSLGYEIILVYIHLDNPDINEARVRQRVSEGGHNVPNEKIRDRIPRTINNITQAILLFDEARLLDNSSHADPFRQVAEVRRGILTNGLHPLPAWAQKILTPVTG